MRVCWSENYSRADVSSRRILIATLCVVAMATVVISGEPHRKRGGGADLGTQVEGQCNKKAQKQSFLWTMEREPPVYFYGTIHVPFTRVWKHIPENVKHSFLRADQVYFELDLLDPNTVSSLASCQLLPQGQLLSSVLPKDMFRRLKRHLDYVKNMMPEWMTTEQHGRGLYADYLFQAITGNWERMRPIWVMLMVNSLTESEIQARGVPVLDLYLAQEAQRLGKQTGAVEVVDEQCVPLNGLNVSQVLFALNQTLGQHESVRWGVNSTPYSTDDLIQHYNCGQLDTVLISHNTAQVPNLVVNVNHTLGESDLVMAQDIDHYFRQELIFKRNNRMASRITRLLRNHPNESFFFAFGAGHFVGNHTVLDILKEKNNIVVNTPVNQDVYLGADYELRDRPALLADLGRDNPAAPVIITGSPHYLNPFQQKPPRHRHRHNRRRNRKRERTRKEPTTKSSELKQPRFNDLWVRLHPTSTSSSFLYQRDAPVQSASTASPPQLAQGGGSSQSRDSGDYLLYSSDAPRTYTCSPSLVITSTILMCLLNYSRHSLI